jgi:hypothetical protein
MYGTMNAFLQAPDPVNPALTYNVLDSTGAPLLPGRPIADAGLDLTVPTGATTLSAAGSLYADTYSWSIVSNPGSAATLSTATSVQTNFNATAVGTYGVQLVASKGTVQSDPVLLTIVVSVWPVVASPASGVSFTSPATPAAIRFADIKAVLQRAGTKTCITCHIPNPVGISPPPIMYADIDRNGDGLVASGVGGTDDIWFYTEVRGRINFSDISGSALLRKPSGHHHAGLIQVGFGDATNNISADKLVPGDPLRAYYDLFLNWILNGAPY